MGEFSGIRRNQEGRAMARVTGETGWILTFRWRQVTGERQRKEILCLAAHRESPGLLHSPGVSWQPPLSHLAHHPYSETAGVLPAARVTCSTCSWPCRWGITVSVAWKYTEYLQVTYTHRPQWYQQVISPLGLIRMMRKKHNKGKMGGVRCLISWDAYFQLRQPTGEQSQWIQTGPLNG